MTRSKSSSYKPVFYLCTFLSVVGCVCLILDITELALAVQAGSSLSPLTFILLLCPDIWFAGRYLAHRKTAASGTTFTKTSYTQPRTVHNRTSRIAFSIIIVALALVAPVLEITGFLLEINSARVDQKVDLRPFATDIFFCSGPPASLLAESGYGQLLSQCRLQRARFMFVLILILAALVEVVCYWRTDIGTVEWVNNGHREDMDKSVELAQV
ncbi:hypothetical protein EMPS_10126 [Entomortierella parvispora]|uniref:Uncharacterized protein n=1 Tax=Entomortierella parvispora TaxID=205924 RepID=A0A9P3M112_9FUNG|nr:hypothetical protein EMPS_10126 [Entomortierella parvispora]